MAVFDLSQSQNAFYEFRKTLDQGYIAQTLLIVAQLFITVTVSLRIYQNREEFPIKQQGPITSIAVLVFFQIATFVSFSAKIIQTQGGYFIKNKHPPQCGQCRLFNHTQMIVLALVYNFLREIPFIIFNMKLLRVSLCYFAPFYKKDIIPRWIQILFSSDIHILYLGFFHAAIITVINYVVLINSYDEYAVQLLFTFFCPKQTSIFESLAIAERYLLFLTAYFLSIFTYRLLDFKRFLIVLFLVSNAEIFLRIYVNTIEISMQTYHQFYYNSLLISLGGTFLIAYFSRYKVTVNALPQPSIIQTWDSFRNIDTGIQILRCFANYQDQNKSQNLYSRALEAFLDIDQLMKVVVDLGKSPENQEQKRKIINRRIGKIIQILYEIDIQEKKVNHLKNMNSAGEIGISDIRSIHGYLSLFCQSQIYKRWKKTASYLNYRMQCENNTLISSKLELFNVNFG